MFLIIPCGHSLKLKVTSFKKMKKIVEVNTTMMLKFNNLKDNERIVLKFLPNSIDDGPERSE